MLYPSLFASEHYRVGSTRREVSEEREREREEEERERER